MRKRFSFSVRFLLSLLLVGVFTSCLSDDDNNPPVPVAGLMTYNLSPDNSMVTIGLSGNVIGPSLPYLSYSGTYMAIFPGNRTVSTYGSSLGIPLASTTYAFNADKYYSMFFMGAQGNYVNVVVNDSLDKLQAQAGKAYIRYVEAIPTVQNLQVTVTDNNAQPVISESANYKDVSDFVTIPADSVTIRVVKNTLQKERTIYLDERKVYTVLLVGDTLNQGQNIQIKYLINGKVTRDSTLTRNVTAQ